MNAPEMLAGLRTPQADGLVLRLTTRTPLYTGGIGQFGDQVHPSNLLGGIRHFSCLVANTLGVKDFATKLWGTTGRAKSVALRVRCHDGESEWLGGQEGKALDIKVAPRQKYGWGFNRGFIGKIEISLLRRDRNLAEPYWQILLLSLRIQIRRAMLGARDQWGMGVVSCENLADLQPLPRAELARQLGALVGPRQDPMAPNLLSACFVKLRNPQTTRTWEDKLKAGLQWRYDLRNSFRGPGEEAVRHWLFGYLARNESNGGGFQVSGAYPVKLKQAQGKLAIRDEIRLWWLWEHDEPPRVVQEILKARGQELQERLISSFPDNAQVTRKKETESAIEWVYGLAGIAT